VRGPEFAAHLVAEAPKSALVFMSGRPMEAKLKQFPGLEGAQVLAKPFSHGALIIAIETALARRRA